MFALGEELRREQGAAARNKGAGYVRVVSEPRAPQRISGRVVLKGLTETRFISQCLAEREFECNAAAAAKIAPPQLCLHAVNVVCGKADRLQIRQAAPRFTQVGLQLRRFTISGNARLLPPRGAQRIAVAHPQERL